MPPYMIDIWRSGRCPHLVPAFFYEEAGRICFRIREEGLIRVADYARTCPDGIEESFSLLLEALQSAALTFLEAKRWLAQEPHISLRPQDLYYDRGQRRARLCFSASAAHEPFFERFCLLCEGLGGSGPLIASRLAQRVSFAVLEEKGTAAFLEGWRREVLEGRPRRDG